MARIFFVHNEHDKASRDLLDEVQAVHPATEVVDFMDVRESVWIQGTPSVILAPTDVPQIAGFVCLQKDINVQVADIDDALGKARVLTLTSNKAAVALNEEFTLTVTAVDLDGNPASVPEDTIITVAGIEALPDEQGCVTVTSAAAGIAQALAYSDYARSSVCEVTVNG